ncbi:MAG: GTPase HflX [Gammaproteobacteria bacterium]|nr:MAG: GTPase HflX [Gammaproteobacteria bacterium]
MFERPKGGERAILVYIAIDDRPDPEELHEFRQLAVSAGAEPRAFVTGRRQAPDPRLFVGSGKAEEIRDLARREGAELVIFDHDLSPSQERNLERFLECRVLDRTGLILDIFAQRARSHEGKLQVELAQLEHLSTRLVRGWTHLERQKGGIGLRGPGETQLETDRRLLGQRIHQIRRRLAKVSGQREQGRRARQRAETPTVSLVGYTNAGKSTLFNRLTGAGVEARDQLFATLDPTLRRVTLAQGGQLVLADTVGFVSRLPHDLVAAFKSTLQETVEADLLLHVIDAASARRAENIAEVEAVLQEIGADRVPRIAVFNKIDQLEGTGPRVEYDEQGLPTAVWLSARDGSGCDLLRAVLDRWFAGHKLQRRICLAADEGRLRALLYAQARVLQERAMEDGSTCLEVELSPRDYQRLRKHEPGLAARWPALRAGEHRVDGEALMSRA